MSRGRQASVAVQRRVMDLAQEGFTPSQIHRELFPDGQGSPDFVSKKTVERMVKDFAPADSSGPWSLVGADPEEARTILDVLAHELTSRPVWPTRERARWIARVRTAAPDIPTAWAREIAHGYEIFCEYPLMVRYIDLALILRPWASPSALAGFAEIVRLLRPHWGQPGVLRLLLHDIMDTSVLDSEGTFPTARATAAPLAPALELRSSQPAPADATG
jgi:hypothetical protein